MDYTKSTKFIASLSKVLQSLCSGYVEFSDYVQITGQLYLSVDTKQTIEYVVDEKLNKKSNKDSVSYSSNSFHAQVYDEQLGKSSASSDLHRQIKTEIDLPDLFGSQNGSQSDGHSTLSFDKHVLDLNSTQIPYEGMYYYE